MVAFERSFYRGPESWRGLDIVSLEHSLGSRDWFKVTGGCYSHSGSWLCTVRRLRGEAVTSTGYCDASV